MKYFSNRNWIESDVVGATAGIVCAVHCLATPFLFAAKACSASSACCADAPIWWRLIDYAFLIVSFVAIYYAVGKTTPSWLKTTLWISWGALSLNILNESYQLLPLHSAFLYLPAGVIIALHFYNMKYCKCDDETCSSNSVDESFKSNSSSLKTS